jgi:hypothetical protein
MSSRKPKEATRERVATMLQRAVEGSRRLRLDDVADSYESMTVDDYASLKGIRLINPAPAQSKQQHTHKRSKPMAQEVSPYAGMTKPELIEELERRDEALDSIWNDGVIAVDEKETDAEDAVETISDILNDFDADRFPFDDDEDQETEEEAA